MRKIYNFFIILLFPVSYILTDIFFRFQYLRYYQPLQIILYSLSIVFTLSLYLVTVSFISRQQPGSRRARAAGILTAFYYSVTILPSYTFTVITGIFPNFYTYTFVKQEPANTLSLIRDSARLWQILLLVALSILLYRYFQSVSKSAVIKKVSSTVNPLVFIAVIIISVSVLVKKINHCDQCMIVDANFTVDAVKHLASWNDAKSYSGTGLPERVPVTLPKINGRPGFNVLLIVFESLRAQNMQIYGYSRETTPFLNSLLKDQAGSLYIFDNAFTVSTTTMLAIPAILTGVTPCNPIDHYRTFPLVWEYAKSLEYKTFFISSHSMEWYRFDRFYSRGKPDFYWNKDSVDIPNFNDIGIDDRITVEKFGSHISDLKNKPFFGVIQFNATHYPYRVPDQFIKWSGKYIDKYDNAVMYQDWLLEKVFSSMSANGLLKNTIVIMAGDHGEAFREHNSIGHIDTFNTETIRVPLIMYIPEGTLPMKKTGQLRLNTALNVSTADIAPTLVSILGLRNVKQVDEIYSDFYGVNLFCYFNSARAIVTTNNSPIIDFNSGLSIVQQEYHLIFRTNIVPYRIELYNTLVDPSEYNNISDGNYSSLLGRISDDIKTNSTASKVINLFHPADAPEKN